MMKRIDVIDNIKNAGINYELIEYKKSRGPTFS